MGFVINAEGEKIKVDNPNGWCMENVVLINNNTVLKSKYLLRVVDFEDGVVAEELFDDYPSDEIILYHMSQNNINRYMGYAEVKEVKILDFK